MTIVSGFTRQHRERLLKTLALAGSPVPGEATAAVAAAQRILDAAGVGWSDVVAPVGEQASTPLSGGSDDSFFDPQDLRTPGAAAAAANRIRRAAMPLHPRAASFISTMAMGRIWPTARQRQWLADLLQEATREAAGRGP